MYKSTYSIGPLSDAGKVDQRQSMTSVRASGLSSNPTEQVPTRMNDEVDRMPLSYEAQNVHSSSPQDQSQTLSNISMPSDLRKVHQQKYNPRKVDALPLSKRIPQNQPNASAPTFASGQSPMDPHSKNASCSPIVLRNPVSTNNVTPKSPRASVSLMKSPLFQRISFLSRTSLAEGAEASLPKEKLKPSVVSPPSARIRESPEMNVTTQLRKYVCMRTSLIASLIILFFLLVVIVFLYSFYLHNLIFESKLCEDKEPVIIYSSDGVAFLGHFNSHTAVNEFLNIPYGMPLTNARRFKPTEQVSYKKDSTSFYGNGSSHDNILCQQLTLSGDAVVGQSDCLHLNIYVPVFSTSHSRKQNPMPVVVLMQSLLDFKTFPREFNSRIGSAAHAIEALYVTFQHRIGALHTVISDKQETNFGLDDTIKVLEWIQQHIRTFQGNSDNVILVTSGSSSTHALALMGSPLANKLFNKVWLHAPALTVSHNIEESRGKQCAAGLCNITDSDNTEALLLRSRSQKVGMQDPAYGEMFSLPRNNTQRESIRPLGLINDGRHIKSPSLLENIISTWRYSIAVVNSMHEANAFLEPSAIRFWSHNMFSKYLKDIFGEREWSKAYNETFSANHNNLEHILSEMVTDARVTCPLDQFVHDLHEKNPKFSIYRLLIEDDHDPLDHLQTEFYTTKATYLWDSVLHVGSSHQTISTEDIETDEVEDFKESDEKEASRQLYLRALKDFIRGTKVLFRPFTQPLATVNILTNGKWNYEKMNQFKQAKCDVWKKLAPSGNIYDLAWKV